MVETNLAPIWRTQSGILAKSPIWLPSGDASLANLAKGWSLHILKNQTIWQTKQSGKSMPLHLVQMFTPNLATNPIWNYGKRNNLTIHFQSGSRPNQSRDNLHTGLANHAIWRIRAAAIWQNCKSGKQYLEPVPNIASQSRPETDRASQIRSLSRSEHLAGELFQWPARSNPDFQRSLSTTGHGATVSC